MQQAGTLRTHLLDFIAWMLMLLQAHMSLSQTSQAHVRGEALLTFVRTNYTTLRGTVRDVGNLVPTVIKSSAALRVAFERQRLTLLDCNTVQ